MYLSETGDRSSSSVWFSGTPGAPYPSDPSPKSGIWLFYPCVRGLDSKLNETSANLSLIPCIKTSFIKVTPMWLSLFTNSYFSSNRERSPSVISIDFSIPFVGWSAPGTGCADISATCGFCTGDSQVVAYDHDSCVLRKMFSILLVLDRSHEFDRVLRGSHCSLFHIKLVNVQLM